MEQIKNTVNRTPAVIIDEFRFKLVSHIVETLVGPHPSPPDQAYVVYVDERAIAKANAGIDGIPGKAKMELMIGRDPIAFQDMTVLVASLREDILDSQCVYVILNGYD
jgi:hypothetical protein